MPNSLLKNPLSKPRLNNLAHAMHVEVALNTPKSEMNPPDCRDLASREGRTASPKGKRPEEPAMRPIPTLLIVEDDESLRTVWQVIFSARGWRVEMASTVAEGLERLDQLDQAPDYLILDLQLPDGPGEMVLRRVREAGLKTRVVITTGSNDPRELGIVRDLHPEALLRKPLNVADVWREGQRAMAI